MNFLTLEEVSQKFGFNRQVWRRWCYEGKLKRAHIEGNAWVIDEDEARAWAESRNAPEARRQPGSISSKAREELKKNPDRPNIEIAKLTGATPSVVSLERRKLGLPRLPHGGITKAPPDWKPERKPRV